LNTIEQTKIWAEFRKKAEDENFWQISFGKNNKSIIQKIPLPKGFCWLYCNRGPTSTKTLESFFNEVKKIAKRENATFLRIEPPIYSNTQKAENYEKVAKNLKFIPAHASHQPEYTLIINLAQTEEDILKNMKQKGRYNIRLAKKKGVVVQESKNATRFYEILQETTQRDGFIPHNKKFYQIMLDTLEPFGMAKLYEAKYKGQVIAGLLATFYDKTATYYYGASSNIHRNVMAPYLLQWHAIKEAKELGFTHYDFLGIAPPNNKKHPWEGVTSFKKKFGGETVRYVKAKEFAFKPFWYWLFRLIKKIKRR